MYMFGGGSITRHLHGIALVLGLEAVLDCLYRADRTRLTEISANAITL